MTDTISPEALKLAQAFDRISNERVKRQLLGLARSCAKAHPAPPKPPADPYAGKAY